MRGSPLVLAPLVLARPPGSFSPGPGSLSPGAGHALAWTRLALARSWPRSRPGLASLWSRSRHLAKGRFLDREVAPVRPNRLTPTRRHARGVSDRVPKTRPLDGWQNPGTGEERTQERTQGRARKGLRDGRGKDSGKGEERTQERARDGRGKDSREGAKNGAARTQGTARRPQDGRPRPYGGREEHPGAAADHKHSP